MKTIIPLVVLSNLMAESLRVGGLKQTNANSPKAFFNVFEHALQCQIICHNSVQWHSAEQDSVVLIMTPFPVTDKYI